MPVVDDNGMDMTTASAGTWLILVAVAVLIGFDKSFLPGAGILGVGFLATVIPARQASGITLALIIVADWAAIWAYRKNVDWRALLRLLPNIVVGVVLGAGFLFIADDSVTKRTIGVVIVVFVVINLVAMTRRRLAARRLGAANPAVASPAVATGRSSSGGAEWSSGGASRVHPKSLVFGIAAGFATMVANAAGPITSLYFLSEGFGVVSFLGTTAWLFLILNLIKLPFSLGLGMLTTSDLPAVAMMVPVIILTVMVGRWLARRVNRSVFTTLVLLFSAVAGVLLLV